MTITKRAMLRLIPIITNFRVVVGWIKKGYGVRGCYSEVESCCKHSLII